MVTLITVVGIGLFVLLLLLIFLPKNKGQAASSVSLPQLPQFVPQQAPQPAPQLTPRQIEVQEKVQALTGYFVELDEAKYKKALVDEAVALLVQNQAVKPAAPVSRPAAPPTV